MDGTFYVKRYENYFVFELLTSFEFEFIKGRNNVIGQDYSLTEESQTIIVPALVGIISSYY